MVLLPGTPYSLCDIHPRFIGVLYSFGSGHCAETQAGRGVSPDQRKKIQGIFKGSRRRGMKKRAQAVLILLAGILVASPAFAQPQKLKQERRPALSAATTASTTTPPAPDGFYWSILNGLPVLLAVHHDTEVGTGKPVDVYQFVIEMQVMNSDGNLEPVGLQIFNFFTVKAQDPLNAINPHNAHDCKVWTNLTLGALKNHKKTSPTWPYLQFRTAEGARMVQTNEDGPVFWSDDVECWGTRDRFPPF
jgi:hypothetical protein